MKKNLKLSGVFFGIAFAYLMFNLRYTMMAFSLNNLLLCIVLEFAAMLLFGAVTVKLFGKETALTSGEKGALTSLVVLYALFCAFNFDIHLSLTALNFSAFSESLANNTVLVWIAFLARFVPLFFGVYFACKPAEADQEVSIEFPDGMSPEDFEDAAVLDAINDQFDEAEEAAASKKVIDELNEQAAQETIDD